MREYTALEITELNKMFCRLCNKLIIYFICGNDALKCYKYNTDLIDCSVTKKVTK